MNYLQSIERAAGVVFDFGGVISVSPRAKWETTLYPYCEKLGVPRQATRDGFAKYRSLWDGDEISFYDFYARVFADAGAGRPSPDVLAELWRMDACGWAAEARPETLALAREAKAKGRKIGILSNMSSDFHRDCFLPRFAEFRALADVEVISGFEHLCKPDRRIYDLTAERMGLPPAELLFFDDTQSNVDAARACGWMSELYAQVPA